MAKNKFTRGGKARGAAPKRPGKPKSGTAAKLTLALVTFLNLLLSLTVSLLRRQEVLHAVKEDEDVRLLLTSREKTEKK